MDCGYVRQWSTGCGYEKYLVGQYLPRRSHGSAGTVPLVISHNHSLLDHYLVHKEGLVFPLSLIDTNIKSLGYYSHYWYFAGP